MKQINKSKKDLIINTKSLAKYILVLLVVAFCVQNSLYKAQAATTELTEDIKPNSLTINAGDILNTNGYEIDAGNGGIIVDGKLDATDDVETDETIINTAQSFSVNAGGEFVPNESTIIFDDGAGTDVLITAGTAPVYNLTIDGGSGFIVQVQDPLVVQNAVAITVGTLDVVAIEDNQINVAGNWTNDDIFEARTGTVIFDGTSSVTLDSGCADETSCTDENFYNLTINKTSATDANDNVTLSATHLRVTNQISVMDGELVQEAQNVQSEATVATLAVFINGFGAWTNTSTGNLTLGGNLENHGAMTLQGTTAACNEADAITIASTTTTKRTWNGSGSFNVNDVAVSYQGGERRIIAYSSTDSGDNGDNWDILTACTLELMTNFQDLFLEGLTIN